MKTELDWQHGHATQRPADRLGPGRLVDPIPMDPDARRRSLGHMLTLEHTDEDRGLSASTAFSMFLFGFGCGAVWTILLTWLL